VENPQEISLITAPGEYIPLNPTAWTSFVWRLLEHVVGALSLIFLAHQPISKGSISSVSFDYVGLKFFLGLFGLLIEFAEDGVV